MKIRIIILMVMLSCARELSAQASQPFLHEFRKGKSILEYSYIQRHDSTFLTGCLKEKSARRPVIGVNIIVKGFPIGTVSDMTGNFRIFLPAKDGILTFDKTHDLFFEFPFSFRKEEIRPPFSHH
jgi:hypothetical protein